MAKKRAKTISLFELIQKYSTEADAIKCLEKIRWSNTLCCVCCGSVEKNTVQPKHDSRYWCGCCHKYFTAGTDTPLKYCKVGIRKYLFATYLLMAVRKRISGLQLSKELSVTQTTTW